MDGGLSEGEFDCGTWGAEDVDAAGGEGDETAGALVEACAGGGVDAYGFVVSEVEDFEGGAFGAQCDVLTVMADVING